jgi:hypothetical protein
MHPRREQQVNNNTVSTSTAALTLTSILIAASQTTFLFDLDKPDGDVMGESEDGESGDDGCLRQKPYVDINAIPVARLELNNE